MTCECQVCKDITRWRLGIQGDDVNLRMEIFSELFERIETAETDLVYYQSILDGSWPTSREKLERALAAVIEQEAAEKALHDAQVKHGITPTV